MQLLLLWCPAHVGLAGHGASVRCCAVVASLCLQKCMSCFASARKRQQGGTEVRHSSATLPNRPYKACSNAVHGTLCQNLKNNAYKACHGSCTCLKCLLPLPPFSSSATSRSAKGQKGMHGLWQIVCDACYSELAGAAGCLLCAVADMTSYHVTRCESIPAHTAIFELCSKPT